MNTNYLLIIVVVVAVLLVGAIYYWGGPVAPATPTTIGTGAVPGNTVGGNISGTTTTASGSIPGNVNGVPGQNVQTQNVVTFTDNGFIPSTLTVAKGTTVVFVNNSAAALRVSSDPHPLHNGYPTTGGCVASTFDSCSNIQPGGRWSFKFDTVGTWGYHDHLNPVLKGTIVVR